MNDEHGDDLSLSELARRIGRAKSLVSRWAKAGRIPRKSNGLFNEAEVLTALKGKLDPARAKPLGHGERSTVNSKVNGEVNTPAREPTITGLSLRTAAAAQPASEFDYGFIAGLVAATYDIGAIAAVLAVDVGATVETGKALENAMTVGFMERSQELMRLLPTFRDCPEDEELPGITYELEAIVTPNWDVVESQS